MMLRRRATITGNAMNNSTERKLSMVAQMQQKQSVSKVLPVIQEEERKVQESIDKSNKNVAQVSDSVSRDITPGHE